MGEQIHVSNELDYKKLLSSHPTYKLNKVLPLSGSQNTILSTAGGNETLFEIPSYVFNFAQSRFDFQMAITNTNNIASWIFKDVIGPIRQIQIYTRAGLYLMDIQYFNNYTKITRKPFTKIDHYLEYDDHHNVVATAIAGALGNGSNNGHYGGRGSFLHRSNTLAGTATIAVYAATGNGPPIVDPQVASSSVLGIRYDGSNISINYTEPEYLEATPVGVTATLTTVANSASGYVLNVGIPFSSIKKCLLSLNKDIYFGGETLIFRVVWDSINKIAYQGTSATVPSTAAAVLTNTVSINNMTLYIASETNPAINTSIINQVNTNGLSVLCDYVYCYKNNFGVGSSQTISLRFNRGHGRKLKYVITAVNNNTEQLTTTYDTSNVSPTAALGGITPSYYGTKILNFYSLLNNNRLQEFNLDCTLFDDWSMMKDQIKGSVIQNHNMYGYNWFWLDNFCNTKVLYEDENLDCGLPLDVEQKWDIYYTLVSAAYNHYTFAITQKMLTINSQGITII